MSTIPNINTIAKEVVPEAIAQVKRKLREIILNMLGFDTTWSDIKLKDNSDFIKWFQLTPEYHALKDGIRDELMESMKTPISIKDKRTIIAQIRRSITWKIESDLKQELTDEYAKQAMDIIKLDPEVSPIMIAAKFIEKNKGK